MEESNPRDDDRERVVRARQTAEALFAPKLQVAEPTVSGSPRRPTRPCANRACWESSAAIAPPRGGRAPGQRRPTDHARGPALAIRPHPQLGEIRHDACAGCEGLWGKRRRHRAHYPGRLTEIRPLAAASPGLRSAQPSPSRRGRSAALDARSGRFRASRATYQEFGRAGRPPIVSRPRVRSPREP